MKRTAWSSLPLVFLLGCDSSTAPPTAAPADGSAAAPAQSSPGTAQVAAGERRVAEPGPVSPEAKAIVDDPDRTEEDRKADGRRHPGELLTFADVRPGMRVADLAAGAGYTTELLVRAAGPDGVVFAQNNKATLERFVSESWPARLARPVMKKVVRVDREFDDPLPPEAKDLDLVTIVFSYHDVIAQKHDIAKLNAAVFGALKPGGLYVVLDHAAAAGTGTDTTEKLHRIDEEAVMTQVTAAGFEFLADAQFLRNPEDGLDTQVWKVGFKTDRFALKFRKPLAK